MKVWIHSILPFVFLASSVSHAGDNDFYYKNRSHLRPQEYLFGQQQMQKDPVFDDYRTIDVGINLGVGSDCGRVDFRNTLQATLKNILDSKYFGDMGKDIIAGSPMLLACYFSPTWCAILKHSQINANFMSQMRLNQCALMDKYVDSRVQDYYDERQTCVHQQIDQNGGNIEAAMQTCNSNRMWDSQVSNWAGSKYGDKSDSNQLIASSAKWAGLDSDNNSETLKLVQSLVGDTFVTHGQVSVQYGDKPFALTPRTHLASMERDIHSKLCDNFLSKVDANPNQANDIIRSTDINSIVGGQSQNILDRQTLANLAVMPYKMRGIYCNRLSNALALSKFSEEMNRSLDLLTIAAQNPNLPDRRRKEIQDKRQSLKDSVDATVELQQEKNAPLNQVLAQINEEGDSIHTNLSSEKMSQESSNQRYQSVRKSFFDCSDGVICDK